MNATLQYIGRTNRYSFQVEHEGDLYNVVIYLNAKGKFIDDKIFPVNSSAYELEYEGTEGEIRDNIIEYLSENWDTLVK